MSSNFWNPSLSSRLLCLSRHKVDARFALSEQQWFNSRVAAVREYLCFGRAIAQAQNRQYRLVIAPNRIFLVFRASGGLPAPTSKWMDWWEEDHETFFGVTKTRYQCLPMAKRALLEARLQIRKRYAKEGFYVYYSQFWYPEAFEAWYWDEGGKEMLLGTEEKMDGLSASNEFWKNRLRAFPKLL